LDSICPTEAGKVAGVKIETDEEKLAGGAEVARERKMQSGECRPAVNGISREKASAFAKASARQAEGAKFEEFRHGNQAG
jgi:hypothetical protein